MEHARIRIPYFIWVNLNAAWIIIFDKTKNFRNYPIRNHRRGINPSFG